MLFATCLLRLPATADADEPDRGGANIIAQTPSQSVRVGDLSVHYKLVGTEGPVTLLVHGGACDLSFWELQVPTLAARGRVLLLDLPGHGQSSAPEQLRYSMDLYAGAINAVMESAGVGSAIVVGHSLGVPVLRQFYRHWPQKVTGFVALDGILIYEEQGFAERALGWLLSTWLYDYLWPPMVDSFTGPNTPPWAVAKVNDSMKAAPRYLVSSFLPEMYSAEAAINDSIGVPLLAVYAQSSAWTEQVQRRIRELSPQATLTLLPDTSHFLMLDRPDETNRLLSDFIDRIDSARIPPIP